MGEILQFDKEAPNFRYVVCGDCRGRLFEVEADENDNFVLHCVNCGNAIRFE